VKRSNKILAVIAIPMLALSMAAAQPPSAFMRGESSGPASQQDPASLKDIGIDQHLNDQVPLDLQFKDEDGRTVVLGDYFKKGRPVILTMVYYQCPMLCSEVLSGLNSAMQVMKFTAGNEYEVVTVSVDPRDTPEMAKAKKASYLKEYNRPGADEGWHFLTGNQDNIAKLAKTVGWKYRWDPKMNQFIHAAGIMLVTPQGKLAQYYYGIEYSPKDLRLGLIEASQHKIGNLVDQVVLYCYHYDPKTGKYGAVVQNMLRIGGAATVLLLGGFIVLMFRRDGRAGHRETGQA
jgi:protein SCO1/2